MMVAVVVENGGKFSRWLFYSARGIFCLKRENSVAMEEKSLIGIAQIIQAFFFIRHSRWRNQNFSLKNHLGIIGFGFGQASGQGIFLGLDGLYRTIGIKHDGLRDGLSLGKVFQNYGWIRGTTCLFLYCRGLGIGSVAHSSPSKYNSVILSRCHIAVVLVYLRSYHLKIQIF